MCTTITLGNVIGVAVDAFLEAVIPLHGHFNTDTVFTLDIEMKHIADRAFAFVQVADKRTKTTLKFEHVFLVRTLVFQMNPYTRIQEGQLTQAFCQIVVTEFGFVGKGRFGRQEVHHGACRFRFTDFFQRVIRHTVGVFLLIQFATATDSELQLF